MYSKLNSPFLQKNDYVTYDVFKGTIMDQLKDELVKDMTDRIVESIQSSETANDTKLEVEISEPKINTEEELRTREVCLEPSGFAARWLQCSLILNKQYPQHELNLEY